MMNIQSTKDNRVWRQGPPPFVGWWNASLPEYTSPFMWRWWDGERWSAGVVDNADSEGVLFKSRVPGTYDSNIVWNDYWPEDAVCPRFNPIHSSTVWKGKLWSWIDGELVSSHSKSNAICQMHDLKTVACSNHQFVDVNSIKKELDALQIQAVNLETALRRVRTAINRIHEAVR